MPNDRRNEEMERTPMEHERMDRPESRPVGGQREGGYSANMPATRGGEMPMQYREDFRDIYRGYTGERMHKEGKNAFKKEQHYRQYQDPTEVYETIISHLTKGVMFHDRMMDLFGFLGLYGFKKMHEYQMYSENMERRKAKCYVLEHMGMLIKDMPDESGLNFIPANWYQQTRHDLRPEEKEQYLHIAFEAYKQWEDETKELLSYCANELMYMGQMAEFKEVMEMVEEVEKELHHLKDLTLKLQSVQYDMKYILEMQDTIYQEYEEKLEECFEKKIEKDAKEKSRMGRSGMMEGQNFMSRRSAYTGRYIRG